MIKAPSIAHYTPKAAVRSDVLWTSLSAGWAIFIMCVILSIFAGMVIWLLVRKDVFIFLLLLYDMTEREIHLFTSCHFFCANFFTHLLNEMYWSGLCACVKLSGQ